MKIFKALLLLAIPLNCFAVCVAPISRANVGSTSVLTSTKYNTDVNTAYNRSNNLPGDCVIDDSITAGKLADGAVTNSKIADGTITVAKLASGVNPRAGRLIRMSAVTASGTWTKGIDVGAILVQVVGGGGASYHASSTAGGNSSFGGHCVANGGGKANSNGSTGGVGGTATSGDINISGENGHAYAYSNNGIGGRGGLSMLGNFGAGGFGSLPSFGSGGGGGGGYCAKLIDYTALGATETITIGAGGTNPGSNTTAGRPGAVIIYEYSL
jgi:hypothetical protein